MILIMQNFGSNPKMSCKIITEAVITTGFLYAISKCFIISSIYLLAYNNLWLPLFLPQKN